MRGHGLSVLELSAVLQIGGDAGSTEGVIALDVAAGGRSVATATADGSIRLWTSASTRVQRILKAHDGRVTALAFSPAGGLLASAGEDGIVKLWNLRTGRGGQVLRGHSGPVRAISFSSDGQRLITAGQDGAIRIWTTAGTRE